MVFTLLYDEKHDRLYRGDRLVGIERNDSPNSTPAGAWQNIAGPNAVNEFAYDPVRNLLYAGPYDDGV